VCLALAFGNERLGRGASCEHGLVGIFDKPVEFTQRELPGLTLSGKIRSHGFGRIEGVRQLVLQLVGCEAGFDHDGAGD
jgi:hypothetical protein